MVDLTACLGRPEPLNQVAEKEQTVMDRVVTQLETVLFYCGGLPYTVNPGTVDPDL